MIKPVLFVGMIVGVLGIGFMASEAAVSWKPAIYAPADFTATPESVQLTSVGTDASDSATFRKPTQNQFNLEVYELDAGVYHFVNDPAAKTDTAALNSDVNGIPIADLISDSGADGVLIRGKGRYPGETVISFGLLNEYSALAKKADGSVDLDKAAVDVGYKFYTGRRFFEVNGVIFALENVAIGDHANNNIGVIHTLGGGQTFLNNVWVYNVYDGIFFDDSGNGFFTNCIFHQTYQPWNTLQDAQDAGYYTQEWDDLIKPSGQAGNAYSDVLGLNADQYPQLKGVLLGNDVASGYNINLFETEGANPQNVYLKNCTIVKHNIRESARTWRHNTGSGLGAFVLIEDSLIINVDSFPSPAIRIGTTDPDFYGNVFNTKFWNYATNDSQLPDFVTPSWNIDANDSTTLDAAKVDTATAGGLNVTDASILYRLDGRNLTTFLAGAVELTLAADGGPVGYRLPATAPAGALPVNLSGSPVSVDDWSLF